MPLCGVLLEGKFEEATAHAVQLCLVMNCRRPKNFPHVNEGLARDLFRVPNFQAARNKSRLRVAGISPKRA